MTHKALEVEVKFSVEDQPVPDLAALSEDGQPATTKEHELSAVYFDTADLRLLRAAATLRRRTGGKDAGWHLKTSSNQGRMEHHESLADPQAPARAEDIPRPLVELIRDIVKDEPLQKIARVDNHRVEYALSDGRGELTDDHVTAWSFLPGGQRTAWREWEFELAPHIGGTAAGDQLLHAAEELLVAAGARPAASPSKLATALGRS